MMVCHSENRIINVMDGDYIYKGKKMVIWGKSISALEAYIFLMDQEVDVVGFTDSFTEQSDGEFAGKPIVGYLELLGIEDLCIFVSTVNEDYLRAILSKIDSLFSNVDIIIKRNVLRAGKYEKERLTEIVECNRDRIEYVRHKLYDDKSILTYDNLVKYRCTNDEMLLEECYESGHSQYFPVNDFMQLGNNETFIDAGAYNGETSYEFSKIVRGCYNKIYLLEPDKRLAAITREYINIKRMHDAYVIEKGAYSSNKNIGFIKSFKSGSSRIDIGEGDERIETITIDKLLDGNEASFIKMDIEGVEREALLGCKYTIEKYHPILAISIYHLEDDLWEIPYYLMNNYPFYNFYIRHYTTITTETILYAIEKNEELYDRWKPMGV